MEGLKGHHIEVPFPVGDLVFVEGSRGRISFIDNVPFYLFYTSERGSISEPPEIYIVDSTYRIRCSTISSAEELRPLNCPSLSTRVRIV